MSLKASTLLLIIFNLCSVFAQTTGKLEQTSILLDTAYQVRLLPNQTKTWILFLQTEPKPSSDLFITVQSPPNDPLQQPFLTLYSESQDLQDCYQADNQFSGICRLDGSKLKANMTVYIEAECVVKCDLILYTTLNQRYILFLNSTLFLKAPQAAAEEFQLQIQVPLGLNFTQIAIFAQVTEFLQANQGLEFYANVGDSTIAVPNTTNYYVKGQPIFWGGEGLYFSKESFQKGRVIKIYLSLSAGMEVKLYSQITNGNDFEIDLRESYFDYTSPKEPKKYFLDLSTQLEEIEDKTIVIEFIVYGGHPTIKVAFDIDFNNTLKGVQNYGTINFVITSSLRKSMNFRDTIYISVTSIWNSDYYLSSIVFENSYLNILTDISYYSEVRKGQLFNYFFDQMFYYDSDDTSLSTIRTYSLKIGLIRGQGAFFVRRCKDAQTNGSPLSCVLSSMSDLNDSAVLKDFNQASLITKKTDEFQQIVFIYDLSSCTHVQINQKVTAYYCFFHIVSSANNQDIEYTLTLSKRNYASSLKQGQIVRDTIFQNQYIYYRFSLSSLQDINEIAIYITLIEGQAELIASTIDYYPEFNSSDPNLKTSNSKRIIYKDNQLRSNIYIGVLGLQLSQFTIGVVVKRQKKKPPPSTPGNQTTNNTVQISKIKLHLAVTQQFVLKLDEKALFYINPVNQGKYTVQVVQLVGSVEMSVFSASGQLSTCQQAQKTSTKIACSLLIKAEQSLSVAVTGVQGDQQKIVIVYYKASNCVPYSLNLPFYRQLAGAKSECISYDIIKASDMELTLSISIAQLLHGDLLLQICINGKCKDASKNRHHDITKVQLEDLCSFKNQIAQSCSVVLNFTNNSNQTIYFNLILQQKSLDVALFDGIAQTVTSSDLSTLKGKNFYFQASSNATIRIFFTSFTSNTYYILAHFVSEKQFITNSTNIYLTYQNKESYNKSSFYQFYKDSPGTSLYPIFTDQLNSCLNCMLAVSVYKLDTMNSSHLSVFEIEVSQEQTALVIGQSKMGFIEQGQIYVYQLQQPTFHDAVLSIRDLSKESSIQKNCFRVNLADTGSFTYTSILVIPKHQKNLTLFVTTYEKSCKFQVSYSFSGGSILEVSEGRNYLYQLNARQTAYFIFNHRDNHPFKIVSILNTGEVQISVSTLGENQTWKQLLAADPLNYPIVGDASQGEIMITENSSIFCQNCIYAIAVTSQKGAKGQIFLTKVNNTIPLSINGLIRQRINATEGKVRNYTFSSITSFNISINVIYGKIRVTVINPENITINEIVVETSQVIKVKHSDQTQDYAYQIESASTIFKINVETDNDSSFTIKASKIAISQRIFEGIISFFELKPNQSFVMEFLNLYKPINNSSTINVLIEVIKHKDAPKLPQPNLNLSVNYIKDEFSTQFQPLPMNRIDSENTINVQFPLLKVNYYLILTSDREANVSVLLVKESLIHLKAESSVMMSSPGIFELYSPFKSVMIEIFSCEGDLSVEATNDYSNFQPTKNPKNDKNRIVLQQSNYGGHFVVSTSNVYGQYFIKAKNKARQSTALLYLMNYYYYDQTDVLPYKIIDQTSSLLTYSLTSKSIIFTIKSVSIKSEFKDYVSSAHVDYYLYVDTQKPKVKKYANCRLQKSVKVFKPAGISFQFVYFQVNFDRLDAENKIFFVGAEAVVKIVPSSTKNQHYPSQLNLIYDIIEITNARLPTINEQKVGFSVKGVILWIILPFALAGLALLLAIKCCIKRYRGMIPDHFVEQKEDQKEETKEVQIQSQFAQSAQQKNKKSSNSSGIFNEEIQ